jgi:hypothetical protein
VRCASRVALDLGTGARRWGRKLGTMAGRVVVGAGAGGHGRRGTVVEVVGHRVAGGRWLELWCVHVRGGGYDRAVSLRGGVSRGG